jgi:hypothetical protein
MKTLLLASLLFVAALAACGVDSTPQSSGAPSSAAAQPKAEPAAGDDGGKKAQ